MELRKILLYKHILIFLRLFLIKKKNNLVVVPVSFVEQVSSKVGIFVFLGTDR